MFYVDTHVVLSYNFTTEETHLEAFNLINRIKNFSDEFYISPLSVLELYCVISRNITKYKMPPIAFVGLKTEEEKIEYILQYTIQSLNLEICLENNISKELEGLKIKVFSEYHCAIKLSPKIKLSTLDTIHIAYASRLREEGKIRYVVSLDKDIRKKRRLIDAETGVKIISKKI